MFVYVAIFLLLAISVSLLVYWYKKDKQEQEVVVPEKKKIDDECCGAHAVCERESLLNQENKIIYYDDEELDSLAGIDPEDFTPEQVEAVSDVFYTLKENEVAGWLRSLQLRNISLPQDVKDAAILIVSERRAKH